MCSGRIDLEFILRAFANGHDGVFIGGCKLNECNYVTQGNYDALGNTLLCRKIMAYIGLNPERLKIEFMNASDGIKLAESINAFSESVNELGPLGQGEGEKEEGLKFKLDAVRKLVPYLRLVERERLRMPVKSEEAYRKFFASPEMDRLFNELVANKMAMSQIMMLLREKPLSTGEIASTLGLSPSEVAKHINVSSMHGLVRYDVAQNNYAIA
ncbi:methyl-viologen-reducing hydrogenase subunit delta [Desulfocarbo indianensis]|nr:methyl-viologen-reducing hydrogenase subunit delta [Desulfocarbo indianensis]